VLEERRAVDGLVPLELDERLGAERRVGDDSDVLSLGELDESVLGQVGVDLDLKDGGADAGIAEEINEEGALEVGDTDGLGEAEVDEALHRFPGLLDAGLALDNLALEIRPSRGVAVLGVDVLESHGEVDVEYIKVPGRAGLGTVSLSTGENVLKTPPLELLADDGLDALLLVESVPKLGDDEEVLALHKTLIDGALDTDTSLLLVAVIYDTSVSANNSFIEKKHDKNVPKAPSNNLYPALMAS
jgi:hypothetical protein